MKIFPSILAADFGHLQDEVDRVEDHVDGLHIDVMDGHLVPNLTFWAPVIKSIQTKLPLDIHLMVTNPASRFDEFIEAGATSISFHIESDHDMKKCADYLREKGIKVGIAIDHDSPVENVLQHAHLADYILVMTIRAGFSYQQFISDDLGKVIQIKRRHPDMPVMIDGGVNDETIEEAREAGVDMVVASSYLYGHDDIVDRINILKWN